MDLHDNKNGLIIGLKALDKRAPKNLRNLLEEWANYLTIYMQATHKWQNRSGAAEAGIHAQLLGRGNQYGSQTTLELRHGDTVWYGERLENLYEHKYAIIQPTINKFSGQIFESIDLGKLYRFV